ncbi:glycosyltransferase family 9 protein [Candidatus Woesearchaeota archaeon]|nr:glycosyltransferase family 9 protein [Candidatus Woesearchaeota archaeon]
MNAQRFIDWLIGTFLVVLFFPIRLFSHKSSCRNILFVKLWAIGESVLTLPALKELHDRGFSITVFCRRRNAPVFEQKFIDKVVLFEHPLEWGKYLFWFDVCVDGEPYMNLSALFCRILGRYVIGFSHGIRAILYDEKVKYNDVQHVVLTYCDLVFPLGVVAKPKALVKLSCNSFPKKERIIGLAPGVAESGRSRLWPVGKWAVLADMLVDYGFDVCFVGSKEDSNMVFEITGQMKNSAQNLAGRTSLKEFFCLVARFCAFVACDTGTMHIAAAQGVPTVGLFCPNTPVRFAPFGKNNFFVYKPVYKRPCINVHKGIIDCSHHNHMSRISVDDVFSVLRRIL